MAQNNYIVFNPPSEINLVTDTSGFKQQAFITLKNVSTMEVSFDFIRNRVLKNEYQGITVHPQNGHLKPNQKIKVEVNYFPKNWDTWKSQIHVLVVPVDKIFKRDKDVLELLKRADDDIVQEHVFYVRHDLEDYQKTRHMIADMTVHKSDKTKGKSSSGRETSLRWSPDVFENSSESSSSSGLEAKSYHEPYRPLRFFDYPQSYHMSAFKHEDVQPLWEVWDETKSGHRFSLQDEQEGHRHLLESPVDRNPGTKLYKKLFHKVTGSSATDPESYYSNWQFVVFLLFVVLLLVFFWFLTIGPLLGFKTGRRKEVIGLQDLPGICFGDNHHDNVLEDYIKRIIYH